MHSKQSFAYFPRNLLTHLCLLYILDILHFFATSISRVSHRSLQAGQCFELCGLKTHFMLEILLAIIPAEEKPMMKVERAIREMQMCLMVIRISNFLAGFSSNGKVVVITV